MHGIKRIDIIKEQVMTHISQCYDEPAKCKQWFPAMNRTDDSAPSATQASSFNDVFSINHNRAFDTPEEAEEYVRKQVKIRCFEILVALEVVPVNTTELKTGMLTMVRDIKGLTTRIEIIGINRKCTYLGDLAILYHNGKTVYGLGKYHLSVLKEVAAEYGVQLPLSDEAYQKWFMLRPRTVDGYPIT